MCMTLELNNTSNGDEDTRFKIRLKRAKILAKLGIASGLLALFASVAIVGLQEKIDDVIDQKAIENQQSYRLKEIDDYTYHTRLKQATLQKLCKICLGMLWGNVCK